MKHGPVLVDGSLLRTLSFKYAMFFQMGVLATFAAPTALTEVGGQVFLRVWIASLAVSAAVALIGSTTERERVEMIGAAVLTLALASYAAAFIVRATTNGPTWYVLAVAAVALVATPSWRAGFLFRKARAHKRSEVASRER
jgi:hypothetical protein